MKQRMLQLTRYLGCLGLVLAALLTAPAYAGLIVELSGTDSGGTVATFTGSGTTDGAFQFNIDAHEIGDFVQPTGPNNQWFDLAEPVVFAPGVLIERLHVDYNPAPNLDDLRIGMSEFVVSGVDFDVSGSSLIEGLSFDSLIAGLYADSDRPDVGIVGGLSLVVHTRSVEEPASLALLSLGFGALLLSRRHSRRFSAIG